MPTDKLVWEIDRKRGPKNIFWDNLKNRNLKLIHFSDYPELSKFDPPDGSHIDYRDKKLFTEYLFRIILKIMED